MVFGHYYSTYKLVNKFGNFVKLSISGKRSKFGESNFITYWKAHVTSFAFAAISPSLQSLHFERRNDPVNMVNMVGSQIKF